MPEGSPRFCVCMRRHWPVCAAVVVLGCGGSGRPPVPDEAETWVTEPEFRIGDALHGDALFSWVPYLRATEDGRIFVLEPNTSAVSVWDRDGEPVLSVGRPGQGPGDFVLPHRVHVKPDGFFVQERSRFTYYADDGTLLRTAPGIPISASFQGWQIQTLGSLEDGSWLGFPRVRAVAKLGWFGDEPIGELPLLKVANVDGRWAMDTVYVVDQRNRILGIRYPGAESSSGGFFTAQFFGASDLYDFDPGTGTVLVVRRNTGVGVLEIVEVDSAGDTVWHRRLTFAPLELDDERIEQFVTLLAEGRSGGPRDISVLKARELAAEAIYTPEYLPAAMAVTVASSGQVWLRSWEEPDTLRAWYSVDRGDRTSAPRKVLVPEWFRIMDATEGHVWGVWTDSLDIPYVVGRRLVRAGSS